MVAKAVVWTDDEDKQLLELVGRGLSGRRIANEMNKSRHAIIGRVYRLRKKLGIDILLGDRSCKWTKLGAKYPDRKKLTQEEKAARSRLRWGAWETKNAGALMSAIKASRKTQRKEAAMQIMRNHIVCCPSPKLIWDLVWCDCRWLVTDDDLPDGKFYCANVVEPGKSYCAAHQKLATEYVPGLMQKLPMPPRKGNMTVVHPWKRQAA